MKTIIINQSGSVENFAYAEQDIPEIKKGEVLVKVHAISINPVDVKARANDGVLTWIYGQKRPVILGWDISGEVVKLAEGVDGLNMSDEVFGMVNFLGDGQAYAEYVAVPADQLAVKPENVSHQEAAAATLAALTAWQALVHKTKVHEGQKVLIHAGSGGVGHYAIQIAKHFGAYVIASSSAKNKDFILSMGADEHLDYRTTKASDSLSDIDIVIDTIAGETLEDSIKTVKEHGMIITLPNDDFSRKVVAAARLKNIDLNFMLVESNGSDMNSIANLLEQQALKSHVSADFNFNDMDKAHLHVETGRTIGKVVVSV